MCIVCGPTTAATASATHHPQLVRTKFNVSASRDLKRYTPRRDGKPLAKTLKKTTQSIHPHMIVLNLSSEICTTPDNSFTIKQFTLSGGWRERLSELECLWTFNDYYYGFEKVFRSRKENSRLSSPLFISAMTCRYARFFREVLWFLASLYQKLISLTEYVSKGASHHEGKQALPTFHDWSLQTAFPPLPPPL